MTTVYEMYAGRATPDEVIAAAGTSTDALFYAHLYVGLYHEALGEAEEARHHVEQAATTHSRPHYMGDIARMHARLLAD